MQTMKTLGAVAATGVVGLLLLKLLWAVATPLLGMLLSFLALALKVGLAFGVCYLLYRTFRRRRDETAA